MYDLLFYLCNSPGSHNKWIERVEPILHQLRKEIIFIDDLILKHANSVYEKYEKETLKLYEKSNKSTMSGRVAKSFEYRLFGEALGLH